MHSSHLDILTAYGEVETVKSELSDIWTNADRKFSAVYKDIVEMAQVIGREELVIPRLCRRQTQHVNVHVETPEAYWHIAVFLPFLDGLLTELNTRFSQLNRDTVQGFLLLPPTSASLMTKNQPAEGRLP